MGRQKKEENCQWGRVTGESLNSVSCSMTGSWFLSSYTELPFVSAEGGG